MKIREKVYPWFGHMKECSGEYGIEIETEVKSPDKYPEGFLVQKMDEFGHKSLELPTLKDWTGHYDNSLRNFGVEYVLREPLKYKDALKAIDDWGDKTKTVPFIEGAPSTSVHVHWNVFNESFMTMANFLTLYSLYENLLTAYSGPLRRSNLFALPIRVCETISDNIVALVAGLNKGSSHGMVVQDYAAKYGSLNLSSISKLGSLEIRCFRGATKPKEIKEWLSILNQLIVYARTPSLTPQEILSILEGEPGELFNMTFGPYADILYGAAGEDFQLLIDKNLWYAKVVADAVTDWSDFDKCMDKSLSAFQELTKKKRPSKSFADSWNGAESTISVQAAAQYYTPPPIPVSNNSLINVVTNEATQVDLAAYLETTTEEEDDF